MLPVTHFLYLGFGLFVIGLAGALLRRSLATVLGSVQVMFAAVVLILCAYARAHEQLDGFAAAIVVALVGTFELAIAVALLVRASEASRAAAEPDRAAGDPLHDWTALGDEERG